MLLSLGLCSVFRPFCSLDLIFVLLLRPCDLSLSQRSEVRVQASEAFHRHLQRRLTETGPPCVIGPPVVCFLLWAELADSSSPI